MLLLGMALCLPCRSIDLLERYPTHLVAGDTQPNNARPWRFEGSDVFDLSSFRLAVGDDLKLELGPSTLGVGHCADGAVWAAVIPRKQGEISSKAEGHPEAVAHVWLRFHPKEINRLFPPPTVSTAEDAALESQLRSIASHKFTSSWHAGGDAMIPEPKDMTVDVDTTNSVRRFFVVDTEAQTARYISAFAGRPLKPAPALSADLARRAFDELWEAFDRDYAMFTLRPEVDWAEMRARHRPKGLSAKSTYELAGIFAEMLRPLRDLHIWLRVAGTDVPVFNRPRYANANPSATRVLIGELQEAGPGVEWNITSDKVGYLTIRGWSDSNVPAQCDEVLEQMRDTRGLIVDVRVNGGGSEDLAQEVARRFIVKDFVYAYSQFRNGPGHNDLTQKMARSISPPGPWRYEHPVVLLIGQKCMSSNESFVAMMSGDPDLTTMGDHTCGSSGNPRMLELPLDITVSVPRWIDYLPDGSPLDERGFQPQVPFKPKPGAFEGNRDDLLSAALERLRR
ncbi:MAG: S41 family peptidase [Limisphaerales bacterium]